MCSYCTQGKGVPKKYLSLPAFFFTGSMGLFWNICRLEVYSIVLLFVLYIIVLF